MSERDTHGYIDMIQPYVCCVFVCMCVCLRVRVYESVIVLYNRLPQASTTV